MSMNSLSPYHGIGDGEGHSPYRGGRSYNSPCPKIGTLVPNRIFVGGIGGDTTEMELKHYFSTLGHVRDCKIILDNGGLSKSYGFVTFETQEEAEKIIKNSSETFILKERKLNIGPAIRKLPSRGRLFSDFGGAEPGMSQNVSGGPVMYPKAAVPYAAMHGGGGAVALMCTPDGYLVPTHQPQMAVYPSTSVLYQSPQGGNYYQSPMMMSPASGATAAAAAHWSAAAAAAQGQWRWAQPTAAHSNGSMMTVPSGGYIFQVPAGMGGGMAGGPGQPMIGSPSNGQDMMYSVHYQQQADGNDM